MVALVLACGLGLAQGQGPATGAAPTAGAEAASPVLKAELTQRLVATENGKEVLKPVQTVKPGDLIEYRVTYTNRGTRTVREVVAALPVPEGLEYQPRSARPANGLEVAVKGGSYGREPLMREGAGGKPEAVPYAEYRHLRWNIGQIEGGAKAEVSARMRVSSASAPAVPAVSASATPR